MGALMRAHGWSSSPLGDPAGWPQSLRSVVGLLLTSKFPMFLAWGPELAFLYNDGYVPILGEKHPTALGRPFREVWSEIWSDIEPLVDKALAGEATFHENLHLVMERHGYPEDTWYTFSYSPVRDETGAVAGMFCACTETTAQILAERRIAADTERQRRLFEGAPGFIAILSSPDHVFEFTNDAYVRLFTGGRDVIGQKARDVFPDLAGQGFFELLDEVYRSGERFVAEQQPIRLKPSPDEPETELFLDFIYAPTMDEAGRVTGIFVEGYDVTGRTLAEAAIRAERDRSVEILESITDAFYAIDAESRFTYVNRRAEEWWGRSREQLIDQVYWEAFPEAVGSRSYEAHQTVMRERRPVSLEAVSPILGRWVAMDIHPTRGGGLSVYFRDVHAQKQAEAELRESEDHYRHVVELNPQVIWTSAPDGQLDHVARRWADWTGTSGLGSTWGEAIHPDDLEPSVAAWTRSTTTGEPYDIVHRIRLRSGEHHWMHSRAFPRRDQEGRIIKWYGFTEDIHERRQAEERMRQSEANFRTLAQAMPNQVWTARPDGLLDWFNDRVYDFAGVPEGSLDGTAWATIVHPEDLEAARESWVHCLTSGAEYTTEFRLRRADGEWRWHISRALPLRGSDGEIVRWVGTNTDIEDQKRAARALEERVAERTAELEQAHEALRQAQKMEAVGQLTGGIAHDFNNLLTGIIGSLDILRRRLDSGRHDDVDRFVDAAVTSANRAAALTHRLLAFSRRQSLDVKAVDVNGLVASMEELLSRTLGENIDLALGLHAGLWAAETDPNQLETALLNLVINARDAMPSGGKLTVETANTTLDESYTLRHEGLEPGEYVVLCVSDTGLGMSPEVLSRAFDPFFTTKPIGQGTGLGLSMIYGFAKQSRGHVRIYSEPGKGTTVKLYLPRSSDAADARDEGRPEPLESGHGEVVLVVEDDAAVRQLVVEVLHELGYAAIEAMDGRAAVPILQSPQRIDLLVTDVGLPGINGRQLAEIARQHRPELKVLFVTGYAEHAAIRGGFLAPGMEMVTKPFALDQLAGRIREMLTGA